MSIYFGFEAASRPNEHCFISYSRGDISRVAPIVLEMHKMGLSMWYDNGLIPGTEWEKEILDQVIKSRFTIFFLTKDLFKRDKTYMYKEFKFAQDYNKPRVCVWLDDIGNMNYNELSRDMYLWWNDMRELHSISVYNIKSDEDKAKEIIKQLSRVNNQDIVPPPPPQPPQPQPDISNFLQKYKSAIAVVAIILVVIIFGNDIIKAIINSDDIVSSDYDSVYDTQSDDTQSEDDPSDAYVPPSINEISVGQHLTFGTYEQDNNTSNGAEDIEWIVLAISDGKALLITVNLLDNVKYNNELKKVTWETCTLRTWMNNDFLNTAFTESEKNSIATTTVNNPNSDWGTNGGNATSDKIFALSIDEAEKYFSSSDSRKAYVTTYAKNQGAYAYSDGRGRWWLRSPGNGSNFAVRISVGGLINSRGVSVDYDGIAVRPALWLQCS